MLFTGGAKRAQTWQIQLKQDDSGKQKSKQRDNSSILVTNWKSGDVVTGTMCSGYSELQWQESTLITNTVLLILGSSYTQTHD